MNKTYSRINWQNEPSIATPINETNLNAMDAALDTIDNRVVTFDTSKANQSDLLQTVKTVAYDTETGVFTFTFWNNTSFTADLNIEKIPVDFSMDEYGVITMTTADGTTYTCDIASLIKLYTFNDSSEIDFTTTTDVSGNKTITASIVSGSITGDKLQPNYLADCVSAKTGAETAESHASQSARDADASALDSEAWAVGERSGQPVPSSDPTYENNAKWWALHGTGSSFYGLSDTNFTNLQDGQIAKYDSESGMWINTEDEGGLLPHFKITSEAGSTVTVVCPDTSVIVPTQTSSGIWQCDVPAYGVYTVHAVINGDDAVRTVTVDTVKEYVIHDEHYSYTLNVYAPTGSSIIVTDGGDETYTGTGAGSTAVVFALHQASTTYTITVTYDGLDIDTTITSSATSGGSGSKTITFGTINLTVDEDLIGETITMEKGTDTVSKVASSTSMVFYPNATGNWRISAEYEGETVYAEPDPIVVSSLSTPVSAELSLVKIPEGATVLPTDDIQTWLACANITDKSYTTLAEVLADRETFETLIADSNACDYMARSTSWAYKGLVPKMTSATTPSGVCTIGGTNTNAYFTFDGNKETAGDVGYGGQGTLANSWYQYKFESAVKVKFFEVSQPHHGQNYWGRTFKVQYSNDGTTFTDITSSSFDMTDGESKTGVYTKRFTIDDDITALYWRVQYLTSYNSVKTIVSQIQFYSDIDITTNQDAMSLIGKYDYCSNALLGNATWAEAIAESDYWDSVLQPLVPTMTSNTTPEGEAIATNSGGGVSPYMVFDNDLSTLWGSPNNTKTAGIGYVFPTNANVLILKIIKEYYTSGTSSANIQYSDDGTNWNNAFESAFTITHSSSEKVFIIPYSGLHRYWRLYETATNNSVAYYGLQFYGRKPSLVSNTNGIIHTAMGNDSVYCVETGDTFTATDGIATVDFSQFDEGVYTFGSTTAKDPTNLSNDYIKQFKITKSPYGGTTELYLMPDAVKTLYWWGYNNSTNPIVDMKNNGWSADKTWATPEFNTNDISINVGGSNYVKGVASVNKVRPTKAYCISVAGSNAPWWGISKQKINQSTYFTYVNHPTTLGKTEVTPNDNDEYYIGTYGISGYNITVYAFWYE